jgi:thermitase
MINKQLKKITLLMICTTLIISTLPLLTARPTQTSYGLIRFNSNINNHANALNALGLNTIEYISSLEIYIVQYQGSFRNLKQYLSNDQRFAFIEEDLPIAPTQIPNDPYFSKEWHLQKIDAASAWDITTGNPNTIIAVLDSGADPNHPDLSLKLLNGWNFFDNNQNTTDLTGHGTKVAGVAGAVTDNEIGVSSIGWQCSILPIRVTDLNGYTSYSMLTKGLVYAADQGAKVAVISFQINGGNALLSAAEYFTQKGGLVFGAGGNTASYVADSDNPYIISVSGTTSTDANYGTYGPYIDLSAPAIGIYTTINGGGYGSVSGTSFSTPLAAGVGALIFSANPDLSPSQVEYILKTTATDLGTNGYDIYYGWGRINASYALKIAVNHETSSSTDKDSALTDTTPPTASIDSPINQATVSGKITVTITATDDNGISEVELYIDETLHSTLTNYPWDFPLDTTKHADGTYTLTAKAYDNTNNLGKSNPISIQIKNTIEIEDDTTPPTISFSNLKNGAKLSGQVEIKITATDNSEISKIELYIDGSLRGTAESSPYYYLWNTRIEKNGSHTIMALAYDVNGNSATMSIRVNVQNK